MTTLSTLFLPYDPSLKIFSKTDMKRVAALILGGGNGTRLHPLTLTRCKPAISFGGRYRLIDIPMSNALNSGCQKIYIFSQFLSSSLHQHILKTYRMEPHSQGFVEILTPEQKPAKSAWYQGTADAIRQNIEYISECGVDYFLILSGDQLYKMHLETIVQFAEEKAADLVIASLPINSLSAKRMGVLKIDQNQSIINFAEKPTSESLLHELRSDLPLKSGCHYLGSMGIYLFRREVLLSLLQEDSREDFGKHLIPAQIKKGNSFAYIFSGYWEDIGTVESFYKANIDLTEKQPEFNLYDPNYPIYSANPVLPPSKLNSTFVHDSMICEGSEISAKSISKSIIGPKSRIGEGTVVENSYLLGNENFNSYRIGNNCHINKAIIDRHVQIGNNVQLINASRETSFEKGPIYIRDGIIIVTSGAKIPDGYKL